MKPLFLFGTLCHLPLLETVISDISHLTIHPTQLPDHAVSSMCNGFFPKISTQVGATTDGFLINGLAARDMARLDFYEGAFEYVLVSVTLVDGTEAQAYFPPPDQSGGHGVWSLEAWVRDWSQISLLSAREVMSYRGVKTPQEIAEMIPMICARAWSRINAGSSKHGARTLSGQVDVVQHHRPYAKYFALDEMELRHEQFDGALSDTVARAVFLAPDATLVLPYDPHRDQVLVVEQIRMGPLARGDRTLWQLEPIAGRLDPGETPQAAARRESLEEAGVTFRALEPVAETYSTPGNSSEFYYIYVGISDLPDDSAGFGGLEAEDEDIRSHILTFDELMQMCAKLQIANAPLVMAAYWLAHHRTRLRAEAGVNP